MNASEMRRSTLPGASLGFLCRHLSEQYFTGVDAAFVVCDFRVPSDGAVRVCCVDELTMISTVIEKPFSKV